MKRMIDTRTGEVVIGLLPTEGISTLRGDVIVITEEGKVVRIDPTPEVNTFSPEWDMGGAAFSFLKGAL